MNLDYAFPVIGSLGALAVLHAGWRGRQWAFWAASAWNLVLFVVVSTAVLQNPEGFRIRGDTLNLDLSLAWFGPTILGFGLATSLAAARAARHAGTADDGAATNWRRVSILAALLPIQFAVLRAGVPSSALDRLGVAITILQWLMVGWAFRPTRVSDEAPSIPAASAA